jgi:NDP-sugar pyrophosphorylase family protein
MNVVIPMAGRGFRFQKDYGSTPKPLIEINKIPMITRAIESLDIPDANYFFLIRNDGIHHDKIKSILRTIQPTCTIGSIDYITDGPACSALVFQDQINNDDELIIANCDQYMSEQKPWEGKDNASQVISSSQASL